VDLLLDSLATYRLARLLAQDDLLKGPRDRVWQWAADHQHPKLAELATCPHCVGVWIAFGMTLIAPRVPGWRRVRTALAVAGAASLAVSFADEHG